MHRLIILLCPLFISVGLSSQAEDIVIAAVHVPPYIIQDQQGHYSGIIVDLVTVASKRCNLTPSYTLMSWARALSAAEHGTVDAVLPISKSPHRLKMLKYSDTPLVTFDIAIFVRKNSEHTNKKSLASLKNLTVGTLRDVFISSKFQEAVRTGVFIRSKRDSYSALVQSLKRKRLDVFIGETRMGNWAIRKQNLENDLLSTEPAIKHLPVYIAFTKKIKRLGINVAFDACLQQALDGGLLPKLYRQYGQPSHPVADNQ